MKALHLFMVSILVLAAGMETLTLRFHGDLGVSFAWPLGSSLVKMSGEAPVGLAFAAFFCAAGSEVLLILSFILGLAALRQRDPDRNHKVGTAGKK